MTTKVKIVSAFPSDFRSQTYLKEYPIFPSSFEIHWSRLTASWTIFASEEKQVALKVLRAKAKSKQLASGPSSRRPDTIEFWRRAWDASKGKEMAFWKMPKEKATSVKLPEYIGYRRGLSQECVSAGTTCLRSFNIIAVAPPRVYFWKYASVFTWK